MNTENDIADEALGKINFRVADRLRRAKGQAGDFVPNGIPGNPFEALCVLYREYRLDDVEDAGGFIGKLKAALQEEYERLSAAERAAVAGVDLYQRFEQYLRDHESDRIRAAYEKWLEPDWGPLPGKVPEMDF